MKLDKAMLINLIPVLLILASIGFGVGIIYPKYNQISEKQNEIKVLEDRNAKLEDKLKKLNDLIDFKQTVEEDLKLVDAALPTEASIPLLLTQVQTIANEAGLSITNLSYSSSSAGSKAEAGRTNVLLSAKGNFNQIKSFISNIENAFRIVDMSSIRFNSVQSNDADALASSELEMTLGLASYYLAVDSQAVTEESISVDVRNTEFVNFINKLKTFKIYDTVVDNTNIGKDNPFNP